MIIRFIQGSDFVSRLIVAQEKICMPFTPSHVEAVMPDSFYLGAHMDGGVQERIPGYDAATIAIDPVTNNKREILLTLEATPEQDAAFHAFLIDKIGKPYDWQAILGFLLPEHEHAPEHVICSALITLALRACNWFQFPLAVPAHLIDPRDLLLLVSGRMKIPM